MRKSFIKLHFIATILLVMALSLFVFANFFYDRITFFQNIGLTLEIIEEYLPILFRVWVANLGFSSFVAVLSYAMEEEMNFTSKTAMYTFIVNIIYALILVIILRKLLRKPPVSMLGGL